MNENWTEKLVDVHLDAPNAAEPSLGFESRMLARVAERKASSRRPVFWMMGAAAAVAAVVVVAVMLSRSTVQKPGHVDIAKVVTPAQPAEAQTETLVARSTRAARVHQPSIAIKKVTDANYPDQFFSGAAAQAFFQPGPTSANAFPSSSALTGEEQMLLAMVGRMSGQQQRALVEALEASRIPDAEPEFVPESSLRPVLEIKNTH